MAQAVSFSLDFENSLIEKNVVTRFDSTSEKARIFLNRLVMETQSHVKNTKHQIKSVVPKFAFPVAPLARNRFLRLAFYLAKFRPGGNA